VNLSAGKEQRGPISKKRNKHLQTILIEATKLAPHWNPKLAAIHEKELKKNDDLPTGPRRIGVFACAFGNTTLICFEAGGLAQTQSSAEVVFCTTKYESYKLQSAANGCLVA
jgi:hypothetical protein